MTDQIKQGYCGIICINRRMKTESNIAKGGSYDVKFDLGRMY